MKDHVPCYFYPVQLFFITYWNLSRLSWTLRNSLFISKKSLETQHFFKKFSKEWSSCNISFFSLNLSKNYLPKISSDLIILHKMKKETVQNSVEKWIFQIILNWTQTFLKLFCTLLIIVKLVKFYMFSIDTITVGAGVGWVCN